MIHQDKGHSGKQLWELGRQFIKVSPLGTRLDDHMDVSPHFFVELREDFLFGASFVHLLVAEPREDIRPLILLE